MRFVVYGAGAVGGVVAGRLAQAGSPVVLVARGKNLASIRQHGLRMEFPDHVDVVPLETVEAPSEIAWQAHDVILLAVKSQDTEDVLVQLAASAPTESAIVCLQNGVANEPASLRRFANVYGAMVSCPAAHLSPGVVQSFAAPISAVIDIGRYPNGADGVASEIAGAFEAAGLASRVLPDIMSAKRRKLVFNLANALEAIFGGEVDTTTIAARAREEGETVLAAAGLHVMGEDEYDRRADILNRQALRLAGGNSSWQSLARGTGRVETDYLNGEIVLLGRMQGTSTPVNELLQRVVTRMAYQGKPPGSYALSDFEAQLSELA